MFEKTIFIRNSRQSNLFISANVGWDKLSNDRELFQKYNDWQRVCND